VRDCQPTLLALLISLCASQSALAADKIKVQIVETTQTTVVVPLTTPGNPEQINTHCDASVNGNTASGDCKTIVTPATDATIAPMPTFLFSAKAILPDGSHAALACGLLDKNCWAIPPTTTERSTSDCITAAKVTICTRKSLGTYQAKRNKDELLIYTPTGRVKYQITGSW
jgi:hypothetical protein